MSKRFFNSAVRVEKRREYDRKRKAKYKLERIALEKQLLDKARESSIISDLAESLAAKV